MKSTLVSLLQHAPAAAVVLGFGLEATCAESYQALILADNPVAYYRLEEVAGEYTAADSSATGAFPGTYIASADGLFPKLEQAGIEVNSVYFKSYVDESSALQSSYVEVPYAAELNTAGPFSGEAWVRTMSVATDGSYRSPVCNFGGWGGDYPGWFFYQSPEAGGNPSAWILVMKGGGIWIQSGQPVKKYEWEHLVTTFDGSTVRFYVNGALIGSAPVPSYTPNPANALTLGAGPAGAWRFDGNVDEVAIYDAVLTPEQIARHYEVGLANIRVPETAPEITQDPKATTQYAGRKVTFTVAADGTAPITYQWYRNGTPIAGATSDTLTFTCAYDDNQAGYKAVATNPLGQDTSAEVLLTVSTDLMVTASPASITRTVGSAAAFRVTAGGALPIEYQWYKNDTALPGETNAELFLPSVTMPDDASSYHAKVTNPWNSINSDAAFLTVMERETTLPPTRYSQWVIADNPVAYWRLSEENGDGPALDAVGSFNGTYDPTGAGNYTAGSFAFAVPGGVPGETDTAVAVTGGARVEIPWALELNPMGAFTAEAWLKPTSLAADSQDYRTAFSSEGGGPTGWLLYQQPNNTWAWVIYGDNWVSLFVTDPVTVIAADTWYHVVLRREGNTFSVFVNGKLTVARDWDSYVPNRDGAVNLGWRSLNDWKPYNGVIDDVAFYHYALTPEQIQNHYTVGVRIAASKSEGQVTLSWTFGVLQQADFVDGPFEDVLGATSPFSVPANTPAKFYRVNIQ
ncbi:MAG TPA: hypothetical protein PKM73_20935 [Verrucomicrobiota bacterium]|nr:hypothetical protein [Verrucomicrobiota bacterium]HNU53272.1 hypothetical protein [Verrucomicrobiota bacterium]